MKTELREIKGLGSVGYSFGKEAGYRVFKAENKSRSQSPNCTSLLALRYHCCIQMVQGQLTLQSTSSRQAVFQLF